MGRAAHGSPGRSPPARSEMASEPSRPEAFKPRLGGTSAGPPLRRPHSAHSLGVMPGKTCPQDGAGCPCRGGRLESHAPASLAAMPKPQGRLPCCPPLPLQTPTTPIQLARGGFGRQLVPQNVTAAFLWLCYCERLAVNLADHRDMVQSRRIQSQRISRQPRKHMLLSTGAAQAARGNNGRAGLTAA